MTASLVVRGIGRLLPMTAPAVEDAALVIRDGVVAWLGFERDLPAGLGDLPDLDAGGACAVPGFVDPHTHLVWAGTRRQDFEERLAGVPYGEILARGGGIHSTVRATRAASYTELLPVVMDRLHTMLGNGTTTVEVKTGYGLDPDHEATHLDVIDDVGGMAAQRIQATYLGAHAVPPDRDRTEYVDEVVGSMTWARFHNAMWCDVFCDEGAFTVDEARRVLTAARAVGMGLRIHADQLASIGATELAAELGCASADHLDHVTPDGAQALAAGGVVGVLLPACALTMRHGRWDAARHLREAGVTIALGTDCNPGTSWCESMPYAIQLGCLAYGLSVEEAFRAATVGAAAALRRTDIGHLGMGARGDVAVLNADHEADLVAHLGVRPVAATVVGGTVA